MFNEEELRRLQNACQSKQKRIKSRLKNLAPKRQEATDPNVRAKWEFRIEKKINDFYAFQKLEDKIMEKINEI